MVSVDRDVLLQVVVKVLAEADSPNSLVGEVESLEGHNRRRWLWRSWIDWY